ncbi:M12 family metallopeptidase [Chitinophaga nivalis]|uniref:M12 family metallopeptidase n=1 Tax=Chitinophaga nivalis TaxID=2991709 RepID=A0ABT3II73_9BACT|nr:M12 family metallopeptidase [Chitinophaga nivalis]MCW3466688.1 M12 family metallopeptidase [Chitinophaga nivalis]MCW3483621.1 M12 family metallopeptidase [Chitinophaga nivalis]
MRTLIHQATTVVAFGFLFVFAACTKKEQATPPTDISLQAPGEIRTGYFLGEKITYEQKGGFNIFQGDILLSDKQLTQTPPPRTEGAGVLAVDRWPQARIYYTIAGNVPNNTRQKIADAIAHYNAKTNIRWIARTNQSNYVNFTSGSPNGGDGWAAIGMWGGAQNITLDGQISLGSTVHEMGHAAGLYHEHTRKDRDRYIRILWNNIYSNQQSNFQIYQSGSDYGTFDFNSVMMYWPYSYSANGYPSIVRADGSSFTYNRGMLTNGDISALKSMYP